MLKIANLEKTYGRQVLFENVSFTMNPGERIGLVGRNGHGKTTLFRLILGEEQPDSGVISVPAYYTIGHLSQHIHFTEDTVLKEGCLGLKHCEDGIDRTYEVKIILTGLGFTEEDFDRNPLEFSGGFQVRLNLAKVLVSEPNLLLLDEPTNYLDIVSIRWLVGFLRGWRNELIIITHDRDFMDSVTTHTMAIHRARLKKISGPTQKIYQQILQEEEVYEKTRINDEKKRKETEQFINRFRAQATKASAVQSRVKALARKDKFEKLADIRNLDFEFKSAPFPAKTLISAQDISFSYVAEEPLISGFNLYVGKKDRIAIIGKNGKGKTTLLNILAGELDPENGSISRHPSLKPAYFGQTNINRLNPQKTIEEEIMDAHPDHNRGAARKICGIMMFEGDNALKKISVLSGGEKSRVLMGKLLVEPSNLLLLDEPTNHLDMESIDSLIEAIEAFDGAVMIVTHSELILNAIATRLIIFDGGKVSVFEGTYKDFLEQRGWESESENNKGTGGKNIRAVKGKNTEVSASIKKRQDAKEAKILNAMEKKIAGIEDQITVLEKDMEQDNQALTDASERGDSESIISLSMTIHESGLKIDMLFKELEKITAEYEVKKSILSADR